MSAQSALLRLVAPLHFNSILGSGSALGALHLRLLRHSLAPIHAEPLEAALRPILMPTETLADAERWRKNLHFLSWVRTRYLESLPASHAILPAARAARNARLALPQDAPPPTAADARALFGIELPTGLPRPPALAAAMERASAAAPEPAAPETSTRDMSFGTLLDACGGLVHRRGALNVFMEEAFSYELITHELIEALADHVCARRDDLLLAAPVRTADELHAAQAAAEADALARAMSTAGNEGSAPMSDDPAAALRVLEVGAGNGELGHYLRRALHARGGTGNVSLVVCDSSSDPASRRVGRFGNVEPLDYREALELYKPHLVLASWMPMGVDWSQAFRRCPTVGEYVLLGEFYDGACGHNWKTWGNPAFCNAFCDGDGDAPSLPPHATDGWSTEELPDVSRWMLSRFASDEEGDVCHSAAIAFRREGNDYRYA